MLQICLFLNAFQKITFYHYTVCPDIFLPNGWFYYSFYGCKTSLLKGNSKNQLWLKKSSWTRSFFPNLNAIVLCRLSFLCSGVFRWSFVSVPSVFRGVPLFRQCSRVFRCSVGVLCSAVPCSGVPGFIVCWCPLRV